MYIYFYRLLHFINNYETIQLHYLCYIHKDNINLKNDNNNNNKIRLKLLDYYKIYL